jgi:hypothetical protein
MSFSTQPLGSFKFNGMSGPSQNAARVKIKTTKRMRADSQIEPKESSLEAAQAEIESLKLYIEQLHAFIDDKGLVLGKFNSR